MDRGDATEVTIGQEGATLTAVHFLIPDCFFLKSSSVTFLNLDFIILQGDSTHPNPFE